MNCLNCGNEVGTVVYGTMSSPYCSGLCERTNRQATTQLDRIESRLDLLLIAAGADTTDYSLPANNALLRRLAKNNL